VPNSPAFDAAGNLYVSDSGDYWNPAGTGIVWVVRPDDKTEVFHAGPFRFANGLAVDPSGEWLYVVQSTAANVARIPLGAPNGPVEVTHQLPPHTVPDGLAFTDDGRLVIACYRPDIVYLGAADGRVDALIEDRTAELLMRPTNVALHAGKMYLANLGGWHISVVDMGLGAAPLPRPIVP
jgi:sugar lactone lactonase YvrE